MSAVSIQSPSVPHAFSSMHTLSPPPTPVRKHACYNARDSRPMPMFFPSSWSMFRSNDDSHVSAAADGEESNRLEALIAAAPVPSFTLKARPMYGTKIEHRATNGTNESISPCEMPPLPFSFNETGPTTKSKSKSEIQPERKAQVDPSSSKQQMLGALPISSSTSPSVDSAKSSSASMLLKQVDANTEGIRKLPSFNRAGMARHHVVNRRRSFVARGA